MRRIIVVVLSLNLLACGGGGDVVSHTGPMAEAAAQFATIDCSATSTDEDRAWCAVTHAGTGPFTPTPDTKIRMGLTLALHAGEDPKSAVLERTTLSALVIGNSGAKILDIKPSGDTSMTDLTGTVMSIASTLKCVPSSSVLVKPELLDRLKSESNDLHMLTSDSTGTVFHGFNTPAIIERVEGLPCGPAFVVRESGTDGGLLMSVFPDADVTTLPQ